MICKVCNATYCTCTNKTCPVCANAAQKGLMLVEYVGRQPTYTVGKVVFNKRSPRIYVSQQVMPTLANDPNLKAL